MNRVQHLAMHPTGQNPLAPWFTACGRRVEYEGLAERLEDVACKTCRASRLFAEVTEAEREWRDEQARVSS